MDQQSMDGEQHGRQKHDRQTLWAPWRYDYVSGKLPKFDPPPEPAIWQPGADRECFLCRAAGSFAPQAEADRQNLVVWRDAEVMVVLNRFPYNNGHVLVAPLQHVGVLGALTSDQHLACMDILARLTEIYAREIQAAGFNIGLNLGESAGAGVPGHLHWHLVPRWPGDQNFMSVTGGANVISQSLESLWNLLHQALSES